MKTSEKIKQARKNAGLTQKELGARLQVSPAMIAQYENGTRNPKLETLDKIADAIGADVWDFYNDYEFKDTPFGTRTPEEKQEWLNSMKHSYDKCSLKQKSSYSDVELLIARNGKEFSTEQKMKLIKLLSEIKE